MQFGTPHRDLFREEQGQTIVEYALVITLIAVAAISVLAAMTNSIDSVFQTIATSI
ncbi:MAG: Flp family type IVb pilin [Gaiellaceae bacterium]